jgi:hypothetical protein
MIIYIQTQPANTNRYVARCSILRKIASGHIDATNVHENGHADMKSLCVLADALQLQYNSLHCWQQWYRYKMQRQTDKCTLAGGHAVYHGWLYSYAIPNRAHGWLYVICHMGRSIPIRITLPPAFIRYPPYRLIRQMWDRSAYAGPCVHMFICYLEKPTPCLPPHRASAFGGGGGTGGTHTIGNVWIQCALYVSGIIFMYVYMHVCMYLCMKMNYICIPAFHESVFCSQTVLFNFPVIVRVIVTREWSIMGTCIHGTGRDRIVYYVRAVSCGQIVTFDTL